MNDEMPTKPEPAEYRRGGRLAAMLLKGAPPLAFNAGLAATLVAAVIAAVVMADTMFAQYSDRLNSLRAADLATTFANALALSVDDDARRFDDLCNIEHVVAARWIGPDGNPIRTWPTLHPAPPAPSDVSPSTSAAPAQTAPGNRIESYGGASISGGGRVELVCAFPAPLSARAFLYMGGVVIALVGVAVIAAVCLALRRHMRPLVAVQQNLTAYASGLETQLAALSLSDTLGQVGSAWNQLLTKFIELQEQSQRAPAADRGQAMQRFESRALRQILDRLPLGVLRLSAAEVVLYANPASGRLLNKAPAELIGASFADAIDDDATTRLIRHIASSGHTTSADRKRGEGESQQTLRFVPLSRAEGVGDGELVLTIEDISYLHEAERARDHFLYHVTHELRTPLTNIQAYAETLTKPGFDDEQTKRECYNVIISETRRLSRLIEDILSISQLEVGTARIEPGEVDLVRLLREMVQDNLGHADEKKIELTLRLPPKAPKFQGDKQRLSVLINNLIGNAIKYTPTGGQATVTLSVLDDRLEIEVADTGIGVAPEDQPRIFDKFYRANSEDVQQITGTGLGLAIAREVARLHGGDIRLKSEKGKGSTFTLELPRVGAESHTVGAA